ncbi:MAG: copper resistance protein CopC [Anaerolineae bacterium]
MKSFRKFSWRKNMLLWGILLGLCYYLVQPYVTLAHAELIDSDPAPGAMLSSSPQEITLTFDEPVTPGSTFVIYDRDFGVIPAEVQTDQNKPNLISGHQIDITESGVYTIQWIVISEDGHPIDGSFSFEVDLNNTNIKENNMELIAAAESTAVNLPSWFAWMMVTIAIVVPFLVYNMSKK